jgi:replication factor A1
MYSSSTMTVNPDFDDAFALRGWYDSFGANETFQAHTSGGAGSSGSQSFNRSEMRSLLDVKQSQVGTDNADYFSSRATIMHIKSDNLSYPACPAQGCNKKVVENHDGWRCEKCDRSYPAPEHRCVIYFILVYTIFKGRLS